MTESVKPLLALKKRLLNWKQLQQPNFSLGNKGEQAARQFLSTAGYVVLDANVRLKNWEIDVVAKDPQTQEIVFCEVKTRSNSYFGEPSLAVDRRKLMSLQRVASAYCQRYQLENDFRFDIISVLGLKNQPVENWRIEHFKNVTLYK